MSPKPRSTQPFHLVLIVHAHQPTGNFESVFESSYQNSYERFLSLVESHPGVRLAIHYSGPLFLWIEKNHPQYFDRLRTLVASGQVELVGGGFYEPILIAIPLVDQTEQIKRLANYIEERFKKRPAGAWLAERVWEPQLPSSLAAAGVTYTLIDDLPFLAAGFDPEELFGPYIAEDCGQAIWVFPGLKELRYLIPFRKPHETIDFLKNAAQLHPGGVAAFGDDMEKFGVWPGTLQHCYGDGWLEEFFTVLESNASWLKTSTPSEYIGAHLPLGRADLPSASYTEMMEWVLPTANRQRYYAMKKEFSSRPDVLSLFRGGPWRAFFRKYSEANLLHKKMLRVSACVASIPARRSQPGHTAQVQQASDYLLQAQGNDAYWHGVFGGLYAPHLRTEVWRNLVRAETLADQLTPGAMHPRVELLDYDADGSPEVLFTAPEYQALLKPSDGATLAALDFRTTASTIINSISRRAESYHSRLREGANAAVHPGAVSIHDQVSSKEPDLDRFIRYDQYPRHSFRVLVFDAARTFTEYDSLQLGEIKSVASGPFRLSHSSASEARLILESDLPELSAGREDLPSLRVEKLFSFGPTPQGCEVSCDLILGISQTLPRGYCVGIESIVNFLAPTNEDRFFETNDFRHNLRFTGALPGPILRMEDGWQRIRLTLHAPNAAEYWIAPIETVSESETGFERVYQGSQILAIWRPDFVSGQSFSCRLLCRLETF
ncbi:MAG: alpha-amylase/4-alpha-glucanotransferase domain-containing protein [Candidatus Acidiferrum sp.]